MNYYFAKSVVHLVDELENDMNSRFVSSAKTYANVIAFFRKNSQELSTEEIIDILKIFKDVLRLTEQIKIVSDDESHYMASNMVGNREFIKEYKEIFLGEGRFVDVGLMEIFLKDYIGDLILAKIQGEKSNIEFPLRNLEYFLDGYCIFHEESLLTKKLVNILKNLIEVR